MYACHYAHDDVAFMLLDAGADARAVDSAGATAVVLADQAGAEAIRLRLLAAGAGAGATGSFLSEALAALTCSAPACSAPAEDDDDGNDPPAWMPIACAGKRKPSAGSSGVRVVSDDRENDDDVDAEAEAEAEARSQAAAAAAAERGRKAAAAVAAEAAAEAAAAAAATAAAAEEEASLNAGSPPTRLAAAAQPPHASRAPGDGEALEVDPAASAVASTLFGADEPEEDRPAKQPPAFQGFGTLPADGAFEAVDLGR